MSCHNGLKRQAEEQGHSAGDERGNQNGRCHIGPRLTVTQQNHTGCKGNRTAAGYYTPSQRSVSERIETHGDDAGQGNAHRNVATHRDQLPEKHPAKQRGQKGRGADNDEGMRHRCLGDGENETQE